MHTMAHAATAYEVRIAEVLSAAAAPMSAAEILATLRSRYGIRASEADIEGVLCGTNVYDSTPGRSPSEWFVRGSAASVAGTPPGVRSLDGLPALATLASGAFSDGAAVVGGSAVDPAQVRGACDVLRRAGVTAARALVGQPAGKLAVAALQAAGIECESLDYADGSRGAMAACHAEALVAADCVVVIAAAPAEKMYEAHALVATAEGAAVPAYVHSPYH